MPPEGFTKNFQGAILHVSIIKLQFMSLLDTFTQLSDTNLRSK